MAYSLSFSSYLYPSILAMALLSLSFLSADTQVFTPLTLSFLPGDDVHISMYSMVLVLWCICMLRLLLTCGPGLLS